MPVFATVRLVAWLRCGFSDFAAFLLRRSCLSNLSETLLPSSVVVCSSGNGTGLSKFASLHPFLCSLCRVTVQQLFQSNVKSNVPEHLQISPPCASLSARDCKQCSRCFSNSVAKVHGDHLKHDARTARVI